MTAIVVNSNPPVAEMALIGRARAKDTQEDSTCQKLRSIEQMHGGIPNKVANVRRIARSPDESGARGSPGRTAWLVRPCPGVWSFRALFLCDSVVAV